MHLSQTTFFRYCNFSWGLLEVQLYDLVDMSAVVSSQVHRPLLTTSHLSPTFVGHPGDLLQKRRTRRTICYEPRNTVRYIVRRYSTHHRDTIGKSAVEPWQHDEIYANAFCRQQPVSLRCCSLISVHPLELSILRYEYILRHDVVGDNTSHARRWNKRHRVSGKHIFRMWTIRAQDTGGRRSWGKGKVFLRTLHVACLPLLSKCWTSQFSGISSVIQEMRDCILIFPRVCSNLAYDWLGWRGRWDGFPGLAAMRECKTSAIAQTQHRNITGSSGSVRIDTRRNPCDSQTCYGQSWSPENYSESLQEVESAEHMELRRRHRRGWPGKLLVVDLWIWRAVEKRNHVWTGPRAFGWGCQGMYEFRSWRALEERGMWGLEAHLLLGTASGEPAYKCGLVVWRWICWGIRRVLESARFVHIWLFWRRKSRSHGRKDCEFVFAVSVSETGTLDHWRFQTEWEKREFYCFMHNEFEVCKLLPVRVGFRLEWVWVHCRFEQAVTRHQTSHGCFSWRGTERRGGVGMVK